MSCRLNIAIAGDSISDTASSRVNWPTYLMPRLPATAVYNYATSGAHWSSLTGLSTMQKMENQIGQAITDSLTLDAFFFAAGTNDAEHAYQSSPTITLGTYETAMGKTIANLDHQLSIEAMRYGLYTARQQWGNIPMFGLLPIQRSDYDLTTFEPWFTMMARMYRRYGVETIDGSLCGIVKEFEPGRYIYTTDNPHPNPDGSLLWSNFIYTHCHERLCP